MSTDNDPRTGRIPIQHPETIGRVNIFIYLEERLLIINILTGKIQFKFQLYGRIREKLLESVLSPKKKTWGGMPELELDSHEPKMTHGNIPNPETPPRGKLEPIVSPAGFSLDQSETLCSTRMDDDEDLDNLLELVCPGKTSSETLSFEACPMLKMSKLVAMIEEGRVLVRSPFQHCPTHVMSEFPFETLIQEALSLMHISKPKIIQSYIWQDILSGLSVAFVSDQRSGKTLGT